MFILAHDARTGDPLIVNVNEITSIKTYKVHGTPIEGAQSVIYTRGLQANEMDGESRPAHRNTPTHIIFARESVVELHPMLQDATF